MRPLRAIEKPPGVRRVILLDVINRFVREPERDLGGDRLTLMIARGNGERSFFARFVLLAVGFHFDREEIPRGRNNDLFGLHEYRAVADHSRAQEDIWDVP